MRAFLGVRRRGFTLIEMMVVMVLLAMTTSLMLPSMQRWHRSMRDRADTSAVVDAIRGAMFSAAAGRRDIAMDAVSFAAVPHSQRPSAASAPTPMPSAPMRLQVTLPPGWKLERVVPATFLASGLCLPGMAVFDAAGDHRVIVRVDGPACRIETLAEAKAARRDSAFAP